MTQTRRRDGDGTGGPRDGSAAFEELRDRATALRREGLSRRRIRDRLKVHNNDLLNRLLEGEPPPEWTKRPNAKDDLRAKARELRSQGRTYDEIQLELGVSKSSISRWVRDVPGPAPRRALAERRLRRMRQGLAEKRRREEVQRHQAKLAAARLVGALSERELFLLGVSLYWAEGSKDKPYDRREYLKFTNGDPDAIGLFLAWLDLLGVARERLRFTVSIHASADVAAAERFWSELTGVPVRRFNKTVLKRHRPRTVRKNTGEGYRGCLSVYVTRSADLYRRVEGAWYGIVVEARTGSPTRSPVRTILPSAVV